MQKIKISFCGRCHCHGQKIHSNLILLHATPKQRFRMEVGGINTTNMQCSKGTPSPW